jgi:hypothetical protein
VHATRSVLREIDVAPCQSAAMTRMVMIAFALAACANDDAPVFSAGSDDPCAANVDEASCEATATPACTWIETICASKATAMGMWPGSGGASCTCPNGELCVFEYDPLTIECTTEACDAVDPGFCSDSAGINNLCVCTTV